MKKAKIILTTITVLAIVGGVLAFKARRGPHPAYSLIGITITSSVIGGIIYTTTVPFCVIDPDCFISNIGPLTNTFRTTIKTITGFSPPGNTRTWLEVVCTPTVTRCTTIL